MQISNIPERPGFSSLRARRSFAYSLSLARAEQQNRKAEQWNQYVDAYFVLYIPSLASTYTYIYSTLFEFHIANAFIKLYTCVRVCVDYKRNIIQLEIYTYNIYI